MYFEFKLQDKPLTNVIEKFDHEIRNPHLLLSSIGESLLNVNRDRHQAGLDPDGKPWEPLKPLSKVEKRKGGPLNKTGEMLQSLNYQVAGDVLRLGFDGELNGKLAFWHHHGTPPYLIEPINAKALKFGDVYAKKVNHPGLPERPLLGMPDSDQKTIKDVATDYLEHVLRDV